MLISNEKTIVNTDNKLESYWLLDSRLKGIIEQHYPYIELVIEGGQLIDIIPTDRLKPEQETPTLEEKIESLQQQLLETQQFIIDLEYQKLLENGGM